MKQKKRSTGTVWASALAIGVILAVAVTLQAETSRGSNEAQPGREHSPQVESPSLIGLYLGTVELDWALPGEYGDPLPTPAPNPDEPLPPELGEIDLGLQLSLSGSTVSGYVDLDSTLVFTTEHTVGTTSYGPSVQGTFDGTDLVLESERVSMSAAGRRLMRQFRLTGGPVTGQDGVWSGEYRETVWGYGPRPLTLIGEFTLAGEFELDEQEIYLPLVLVEGEP
jgi:hypothetical protein